MTVTLLRVLRAAKSPVGHFAGLDALCPTISAEAVGIGIIEDEVMVGVASCVKMRYNQ
ncbi:hypothetical protein VD0002_g5605 [Verticillium dahliae]|uniref:Uncharacterized protein n=1 Tax=Verticillium dahliae TaxID=27337 RepID=A0AA45AHA9_VERDA|nr:hypothetical protein BJF96_g10226 [Verticillium dahliae]PNH50004.1 hypothetical protein VD0003_g7164 [Verticillium dahliae]PNH62470.1 hypothetical protein VD0002_g5605 [Verticillium dahliae]